MRILRAIISAVRQLQARSCREVQANMASFVGFAPTDEPQVVGIVMIDEPVGTYYGGVIAAPVMKEIFDNILPYLHIKRVNVI